MNTAFLYPILVQVALTFLLVLATAFTRVRAIASGAVKPGDVALGQKNWPAQSMKVSNAYQNQLESPILFYAGVILAGMYGVAGDLLLVLAWIWVALRVLHAAIHVTSNHMLHRFLAFAGSISVLLVFWIVLAVSVLTQ